MRLGAGEELYLIPGIDMINHSTRRQECNTALEQSSNGVIFQRAPDQPSEEYTGGLFVMKAGRISVHAGLGKPCQSSVVCPQTTGVHNSDVQVRDEHACVFRAGYCCW